MRGWFTASLVLLVNTIAFAAPDQIIEVRILSADQLTATLDRAEPMACRPGLGWQQFIASPDQRAAIEAMGLETRTLVNDLSAWLDAERQARQQQIIDNGGAFHQTYHDYPAIEAYLDTLVAMNPAIATKIVIGQSLQGRDMYAIRIAAGAPGDKPAVAVTAMQHAREWAAGASALWIAEQLIENYNADPEITALVDNLDWHIIPVCNPDGYQWTHTDYRLWRKNRRTNPDFTVGVDLNRNWGYEWAGGPAGSSSSTPSSDVYRGTAAFSELENRNVRDYLQTITTLRGHIDLHTYSQLILGPWGYSETITPPREAELRLVQEDMESTMNDTHGVIYQAGLGVDQLLYTADGTCPDWVFGELNAQSWTYELRDTGFFGFELPANQIIPTATEAFAGIKRLAYWAQEGGVVRIPNPITLASDAESTTARVDVIPMHQNTVTSATLYYRFDAGAYTPLAMNSAGGEVYQAAIPPGPCAGTVEYYAHASFSDGSSKTYPDDAPANPLSAPIAPTLTILADDFEADLGWTTQVNGATSGAWQRGVPVNDPSWAYDPASDADGSGSCYLTQNAPGNTDVDNGSVTLISPALDLSQDDATIEYFYFLQSSLASNSGDTLAVEVSANGLAGPWTQVELHTEPSAAWRTGIVTQAMLDTAGIGPGSDIRVRFTAADDTPQSVLEAGIDGVVVRTSGQCPDPACPGDVDGNLTVDIEDLNAVLSAWQTSVTPGNGADLTGDGVVDIDDLNEVLASWQESC